MEDRCIDAEFFKMVSKGPLSDPVHWWDNWHVMKQLFDATLLLHTSQLYIGERNSRRLSSLGHKNLKDHAMWWIPSTPFGCSFCLPVLYLNDCLSWVNILKSCWTINFNILSKYFKMVCYLNNRHLLTLPLFKRNKVTTFKLSFEQPGNRPRCELILDWNDER